MTSSSNSLWNRVTARLNRKLRPRPRASQALYDEILYHSSHTQSLEALLKVFPDRICTALSLSAFKIFLREKSGFVLQNPSPTDDPTLTFPASSSTVSRMRRDRKPALFVPEPTPHAAPDGWQLLAEPFEIASLTAIDAQVLLPLEGRTGLMGFATLHKDHSPFSAGDLRFLRDLGPEMGHGLETAQLVQSITEQAVERARVNRELELAREVQERLLPVKLPSLPGVDVAAAYRSAEQVGGDYYDLFTTPAGAICMVVADVSGKGIAAAIVMAALRASLHALMLQSGLSVPAIAERLNGLLYNGSSASRYATLFLAIYDPTTQRLTSVNAGHNPPLLHRADGTFVELTCGGPVVGLLPVAVYESETLTIALGDTLVAYTDGVTEARDPRGDEWGDDHLKSAIRECAAEPTSRQMVQSILTRFDRFVSTAPQTDDITLVVFRSQA